MDPKLSETLKKLNRSLECLFDKTTDGPKAIFAAEKEFREARNALTPEEFAPAIQQTQSVLFGLKFVEEQDLCACFHGLLLDHVGRTDPDLACYSAFSAYAVSRLKKLPELVIDTLGETTLMWIENNKWTTNESGFENLWTEKLKGFDPEQYSARINSIHDIMFTVDDSAAQHKAVLIFNRLLIETAKTHPKTTLKYAFDAYKWAAENDHPIAPELKNVVLGIGIAAGLKEYAELNGWPQSFTPEDVEKALSRQMKDTPYAPVAPTDKQKRELLIDPKIKSLIDKKLSKN